MNQEGIYRIRSASPQIVAVSSQVKQSYLFNGFKACAKKLNLALKIEKGESMKLAR